MTSQKVNKPKKRAYFYWSGEWRERQIYLQYMSGVSRNELATKYGMDTSAIHRAIYRAADKQGETVDAYANRPDKETRYRLYMAGISVRRIAEEFGVSYQAVQYHAKMTAFRKGLTPQQAKEIREKGKQALNELAISMGGKKAAIDFTVKQIMTDYLVEPDDKKEALLTEQDVALQEFIDILGEDVVLGKNGFDKSAKISQIQSKIGGQTRDVVRLALEFLDAYIEEEQYQKWQAKNGTV